MRPGSGCSRRSGCPRRPPHRQRVAQADRLGKPADQTQGGHLDRQLRVLRRRPDLLLLPFPLPLESPIHGGVCQRGSMAVSRTGIRTMMEIQFGSCRETPRVHTPTLGGLTCDGSVMVAHLISLEMCCPPRRTQRPIFQCRSSDFYRRCSNEDLRRQGPGVPS